VARQLRDDLGVPKLTKHSFRKSVATLIHHEGPSARIGAEWQSQLAGQTRVTVSARHAL
jgi:hypothetical protein